MAENTELSELQRRLHDAHESSAMLRAKIETLERRQPAGSARTEYRSVLWGSFVQYGENVMTHDTLEEAIARVESMPIPVRRDVQNGIIDFYTVPNGALVATVRCCIVPVTPL